MPDSVQFPPKTTVVEIAGKVTIGYDAQMRDAIDEAIAAGAKNVLLKMDRVTKIDSSGIGELAAAHLRIKKLDGRLLLVGLSSKLAAPLQIANLMGVLEIYTDADEALSALEEEPDQPEEEQDESGVDTEATDDKTPSQSE
jgi:anti-anti-sigma factor